MLLNTLVKTVKRKSHRGTQSITTDQITADIVACINEAMRDCVRMLPKQFFWKKGTVSLSVGTIAAPALYSLASDVQEPIFFWYAIGSAYHKLVKVQSDLEWLDEVWDVATARGLPAYYRQVGPNASGYKQIEVFPIPNSSITLNYEYYRMKTADLTSADLASELPDLPDYIQDVVEKGALYYFLKSFDDGAGEIAKRDYEQSKLEYENCDERHADVLPSLRWQKNSSLLPGFRLT